MAFVYALADPRTLEVRYIGSANDPHERFKQHVGEMKKLWKSIMGGVQPKMTKKLSWLLELQLAALEPVLILLTECTIEEKWFWENFWMVTCHCLYSTPTQNLVNDKWMSTSIRAAK